MATDKPEANDARPISAQGAPLSEILRPAMLDDAALRSRSRRGFIAAGLSAAATVGAWHWLRTRSNVDGALWPLRKTFQANERVGLGLFSSGSRAPRQAFGSAPKNPRVNGDIGLDSEIDLHQYRVQLSGLARESGKAEISLDDLRALPKFQATMQLCCIEGWSIFVNWGGVRFSDFMNAYPPATKSGLAFTLDRPDDIPAYVAMATPDQAYYVGLDRPSVMHPQTMLAYEIDGKPLSSDHGAPLRLVIPTKYGIKNLKRIGSIDYTAQRPRDYWAEQGYDWFSGL